MYKIPVSDGRWRWLESTRELQVKHYGRDYDALARDPELLADTLMMNFTAAVVELGEVMDEVGWKTWITNRGWVNRKEFIGEIVDHQHFIANMLTAVGCTDDEYEEAYRAKQQVNRDRMTSGTYDGVSTKCMLCHRALDDTTVECHIEDTQDMAWCDRQNAWYSRSIQKAFQQAGEDA
jgi:hypothetical protein